MMGVRRGTLVTDADREQQAIESELLKQALSNLGMTSAPDQRHLPGAYRNLQRELDRLRLSIAGTDEPTLLITAAENLGLSEPLTGRPNRNPAEIREHEAFQSEVERLQAEAQQQVTDVFRETGSLPAEPVTTGVEQPAGTDFSAVDAEIAQLEQELAGLPTLSQGPAFAPPQAPPLPGAEMLQNPLLQAIQGDVTRRVFANQAARRRMGGAETAVALQNALAPTALNLGLTQQARQQAQQQQNISNLFNLFGLGANVASGQASQGLGGAQGVGGTLQAGGAAQAAGALGQGQAVQQGLGGLAQVAGAFSTPQQQFTGELFGGAGGFRPAIGGGSAAGPLTQTGSFFGG